MMMMMAMMMAMMMTMMMMMVGVQQLPTEVQATDFSANVKPVKGSGGL